MKRAKKDILIQNLITFKGNISKACEATGISRPTFYSWCKQPNFKKKVEIAEQSILDHVESKLMDCIEDNYFPAIKYFLDNKGKDRGYNTQKNEIEVKSNHPVIITLDIKKPEDIPDAF